MKLLKPAGSKQGIVTVRTCISAKCENTTDSFYCDACWERLNPPTRPA